MIYDTKKVAEKYIKKIGKLSPNLNTTSQPPEIYAKRFLEFFKEILNYKEIK